MAWAFGISAVLAILAAFVYSERRYKAGYNAGYNAAELKQAEKEKTENEKLTDIISTNNNLGRNDLLSGLQDSPANKQ